MFPAINAIADALGPWVDPIALPALRQLYFPLSRLWAAASIHPVTDARFAAETGIAMGNPVLRHLATGIARQVVERHHAMRQADRLWEAHFFGPDARRLGRQGEIEAARRAAAARWMASRGLLTPLRLVSHVPPVRWRIPVPAEVDAAYGRFLDRPAEAFMPALPWPEIEVSQPIETGTTRSYWVRFPAPHPRLADMTSIKIVEPISPPARATVIAGNGVCIEPEMYPSAVLEIAGSLAGRGLRVIEMTSPWHGRRTAPGWYGGEMFFAGVPLSTLDLFIGQSWELAVLIDWCRRAFHGPVGVVGVSMSALVTQLALSHATSWPLSARPDAAFLVLHSGAIDEIAFTGELVETLGILEGLEKAGWSRAALLRWSPLLIPSDTICVAPDRVVSLLARDDRIMPVAGGIAQLDRWRIPASNRFVWPHSHMSVPAMLRLDDSPVQRFVERLTG